MNFSIIGSGNMAYYFGERCLAAGHKVDYVIARNEKSGTELANKLQSKFSINLSDAASENVLLAVPDNAIRTFANDPIFSHKNVIHTSGSIGLHEIKHMSDHIACLWPIYSIQKNQLPERNDVPFVMQASSQKMRNKAIRLVKCLTNNLVEASDEEKATLHLVAVFVNNFTNHLYTIGNKLLEERALSFDIMLPLIQAATAKLSTLPPADMQTGPAKRADHSTMLAHLKLLENEPTLQQLYRLISASIQHYHLVE